MKKKRILNFSFLVLIGIVVLIASYDCQLIEDDQDENPNSSWENGSNTNANSNQIEQENSNSGGGTGGSGFERNVENVSVKIGQHASLPCFVPNIASFKVIWSKDGDILTLGTSKISSDARFHINHRYVNEWHLEIDNVQNEDEGEYVCKTNGDFLKLLNLQVLVPPTINDAKSTPAGIITVQENNITAPTVLKCYADSKPAATIKWYKWKKTKGTLSGSGGGGGGGLGVVASPKEELHFERDNDHHEHDVAIPANQAATTSKKSMNELVVKDLGRNDANTYECVARNAVPPATSRIFTIEIQFIPNVDLKQRKPSASASSAMRYSQWQQLDAAAAVEQLECRISANPLDRIEWYRNEHVLSSSRRPNVVYKSDDYENNNNNNNDALSQLDFKIDTHDVSNLNELFSTLSTLTILKLSKQIYGEYKCCAVNFLGESCSSLKLHDSETHTHAKFHSTQMDEATVDEDEQLLLLVPTSTAQLSHKSHKQWAAKANKHTHHHHHLSKSAVYNETNKQRMILFNASSSSSSSSSSLADLKDKRRHFYIPSSTKDVYSNLGDDGNDMLLSTASAAYVYGNVQHQMGFLIAIICCYCVLITRF